jgi:hypothetical protein
MKFEELPIETQEKLRGERENLFHKNINDPYHIEVYNKKGTRYLVATRAQKSWNDNKGNYMPFGGGSEWTVRYGEVQFRGYINPVGKRDYELCNGKEYRKSLNGTEIPKKIGTKKEVLELIKKIGVF